MRSAILTLLSLFLAACSVRPTPSVRDPALPLRTCGGFLAEASYQLFSLGMPEHQMECQPRASSRFDRARFQAIQDSNEERLANLKDEIESLKEKW